MKKKYYAIITLIALMLGSSFIFFKTENPSNTRIPLNTIDLKASSTDFIPEPDPPHENCTWDFDEGEIVGWKTETYINDTLNSISDVYYNISDITYKKISGTYEAYLVQLALLEWNTSENTFQEVEGLSLVNTSYINFTYNFMASSEISPIFPYLFPPYFIPMNDTSLAMQWCANALANTYGFFFSDAFGYPFSNSSNVDGNSLTINLSSVVLNTTTQGDYSERGILESGEMFLDMDYTGIMKYNMTYIFTKLDPNPFNEIGEWSKDVGDVLYYGTHHGTSINKTRYEITKIENTSLYYNSVYYAQVVKANVSVWNNSLQSYIQTETDAIIAAASEINPWEPIFLNPPQSTNITQGNATDPQHDFEWMSGGHLPEEDEPDPMYDLKYLGYNATGNINLTVYGTLDATDGNMTAANPLNIIFADNKYMYQIGIGTNYDDGYDQIRAYISRMDMSTMEQDYWNGSNWVADAATMDSAGDENWDLCESDPDDGSQILMNISDVTGIDIAETRSWQAMSMIDYPNQGHYAIDKLSITKEIEAPDYDMFFLITPQGTTGDDIFKSMGSFTGMNISSGRTWVKMTNTSTGGCIYAEILPTGLTKDFQVVGEGLSSFVGELTNVTSFNIGYYNNFSIISGDFDTIMNPSGTSTTIDLNITVSNPSLLLYSEMNTNPTFSSLENAEIFVDIMVNESDNMDSANITFSNPKYVDEDVTLWWYNESGDNGNGIWEEISYTDLGGGNIRVSVDHLSIFALTGKGPTWNPIPEDQPAELGEAFSYEVNAEDPSDIDQYWLNSTTNFQINPTTGEITNATDLSLGNYGIEIFVNDTLGNINSTIITITVEDTTDPVWNPELIDQPVELGEAFSYDVHADDLSTITYSIDDTTNFQIDSSSGLITNATALTVGDYELNITAEDASGNQISKLITITVEKPSKPSETPFFFIPPAPPAQIPGYSIMFSLSIAAITVVIILLLFKRKQKYLRIN